MRARAPLWYESLWRLALPFALLRLLWRGRKEPGYREHIGERLGRYPEAARADSGPVLWIHAVSVGETRAAQPLVAALAQRYPDHRIVLTHMTAAGRETGRSLFGDRVTQAFLPYDVSFAVNRFLDWCRPRCGLLMETELWPNLILRAAARRVPLFLVNARLSARSAAGYSRFARLSRDTLRALAGVAAQNRADADRLSALGATAVAVTGNVKFDLAVPSTAIDAGRALRDRIGADRPVWVAGSTREGEEQLLIAALGRSTLPAGSMLILVPRHPQRFDEVAALLDKAGQRFVRRSSGLDVGRDTTVLLGDTMGEMLAYYAAADVAFVGGTLLPLGGQNLIEPLAVGTPVIVGPSTFNFAEVARASIACGATKQVGDPDAMVQAVGILLGDHALRAAMAHAGKAMLDAHRGATKRTVEWIASRLGERENDMRAAQHD